MASDPYESGIYVSCEKKKLSVYLSIEYANSRVWRGIGQYKIDSGKISNFPYTVTRNFNGIYLDNPKTFIADLVKAKNKFTFKVSSSNGSVLSFPKNDFLSYRSKFAKLGCKF